MVAIKFVIRKELSERRNMKTVLVVLLLVGLVLFQSRIFSGELKLIGAILGVACFVGLIAWLIYEKKKEASDPVLMLNDIDSD